MKKILLLILTLFLFFACYFIYQVTEKKTFNYVLIGDELVNNQHILSNNSYKNDFVSNDYRVIDLLRIMKYNEEILVNNQLVSIHQQLKNADVLIISIGRNEIFSKLNDTTKNKYTYLNKFIYNLEELFLMINRYNYEQIFFIGYNNDTEKKDNDFFQYLNVRIKKIAKENKVCFIDLKKLGILSKNNELFSLNDDSYKKIYNFIVEKIENC